MTSNELRQKFLDFFKSKGHVIIPSASLLPREDPTTLFTSSGMQPMVPYLLGEVHPAGRRLADSQKCFRSQDIDEVGDNRHTTFFEMLGNWSLGDYFKTEQIGWMFEFLTDVVGLDPKRLYMTVFRGNEPLGIPRDDESVGLWQKAFATKGITAEAVDRAEEQGMGNGRIFFYDETKNWWSRAGVPSNMPVGEPGGPDTEMFWDFGAEHGFHERWVGRVEARATQPCHVNCDCGRFMEIGNNVFMQYVKRENGFELLPKANVDFGGGLERMVAAARDESDVFRIDLFDRARVALEQASGKRYGIDEGTASLLDTETFAFRVVLDHVRAATFLIADGAAPSNKGQGYMTRRFLRRAVRFVRRLGVSGVVLRSVSEAFLLTYADAYPELLMKRDDILSGIEDEEKRFAKTIDQGLIELNKLLHIGSEEKTSNRVDAKKAFDIYQTYGFPLEMIQEELAVRGLLVDEKEFAAALAEHMKQHQEISRVGSEHKFHGGLADHSVATTRLHTANHLVLQALKNVLGPEVNQRGSNITQERLRFDFSWPEKLTPEQIAEVEAMVNEQVGRDLPVHYEVMPLEKAKSINATGVFDERYAENVKVYHIGNPDQYFSREICGGPHVRHTAQVGRFKITKEEAVSQGVRRIKAVVSGGAELKEGEAAGESV